ncbi:MAG: di-trans,poly-cis-decaprenylcistransferase [Spiroplasma sp.]|nr:di-trans,poly-cis-decaprenylcistransferase [Mycoplasmatales bacterium]
MFFKKKVVSKPELEIIPKHVGIIMDGNGRWAKARNLPVSVGHTKGAERLEDCLKVALEVGIEVITFYAFSTENWKREQDEIDHIVKLLFKFTETKTPNLIKNGIKFNFIGSTANLPLEIKEVFTKIETKTASCDKLILNFAFNYGARLEIVEAVNELNKLNLDVITEKDIDNHLYTSGQPDVDLLIRTSGEVRVSNFLLWQIAYAEMIFPTCNWPEFKPHMFYEVLDQYQRRDRRFGGR